MVSNEPSVSFPKIRRYDGNSKLYESRQISNKPCVYVVRLIISTHSPIYIVMIFMGFEKL